MHKFVCLLHSIKRSAVLINVVLLSGFEVVYGIDSVGSYVTMRDVAVGNSIIWLFGGNVVIRTMFGAYNQTVNSSLIEIFVTLENDMDENKNDSSNK